VTTAQRVACLLALLLASCATVPPPAPLPSLASVPAAFEMSGRLAVRQGDRSEIAKLRWTHRPGSDRWAFASPLGNEVARIESSPAGATLTQAGGQEENAGSFAELTQRIIGIALDPATLATWLHGGKPAAAPGDWSVAIEETQRAGEVDLARRINATRGDIVVRLVVDEYRALPE
jgi:outer membrane biogenesis lipoprotein LolB